MQVKKKLKSVSIWWSCDRSLVDYFFWTIVYVKMVYNAMFDGHHTEETVTILGDRLYNNMVTTPKKCMLASVPISNQRFVKSVQWWIYNRQITDWIVSGKSLANCVHSWLMSWWAGVMLWCDQLVWTRRRCDCSLNSLALYWKDFALAASAALPRSLLALSVIDNNRNIAYYYY